MKTALLVFCSLVGFAVGKELFDNRNNPFSRSMSDFINSLNTTWQAGPNFHSSVRVGYIRGLMGEHPNSSEHRLREVVHGNFYEELPESFDARQHWPHCDSIGLIRDQSSCGACWALSAVSAMSDRICIHSKGKIQVNISAEDLLTCCDMCSFGCFGGNSSWAWRYWRETGIVSGGLYGTQDGCKPYTLPPCDHHVEGPLPKCGEFLPTPKCVNACRDGYDRDYQHDRFYGKEVYSIGKNEKQIRVEILKNGPLQAVMLAYEDFLHYKTGVYKHVSGKLLAGHAVKIIGWGTEKGTPYWLVANSWNTHWGDKGYFKILRGSNECNIEGQIHAGIPKF